MSFLKKEVKRIGYLAKPLQPPSSLYETTYTPPQVLPSVVPLKKRRRMTKSPVEYFYEEPYHELMKKMEKEEVQQQMENLTRSLLEEQQKQVMTQRFLESQRMTPEQIEEFQRYIDLHTEAMKDPQVFARLVHTEAIEKDLEDAKARLLKWNSWLDIDSQEDKIRIAKNKIKHSPVLDDDQKQKLLSEVETKPKELLKRTLTLRALPYLLQTEDIRVLTDLLRDKLHVPIESEKPLFRQVKELLEDTFDENFQDFWTFIGEMGPQYKRALSKNK